MTVEQAEERERAALGSLVGILIALIVRNRRALQIEQEPLEWLDRERDQREPLP